MAFAKKTQTCAVLLAWFLPCFSAFAERVYNMPKGVTPISQSIYDLHMLIFWICVAIGVVVFSVMFYALFKHRKSKGAVAAKFHEHPVLEAVWAIIPLFILVAMAIPATRVILDMEDSSEADVTVKITGYQWKWKYDYLDEGISFFSNLTTTQDERMGKVPKKKWYLLEVDKPLVLPVNKKVRFLITSNDVIHSWWVPDFGVKKDGIPGFIHESWAKIEKVGTYRGQCTELCGMNHGFMPIVVEAKSQEDYDAWVKQKGGEARLAREALLKPRTKKELIAQGKASYTKNCSVCHKPDGSGMPPAFPSMIGSPVSIGPVNKHIDVVANGVAGTGMQAFGQQLDAAEIAALVTYERNAWGNEDKNKYGKFAGGVVRIKEVEKILKE